MKPITKEIVDLFVYEDGILRWKNDVYSGRKYTTVRYKAGTLAGSKNSSGHIQIRIGGKSFQSHRIIYTMFYHDPQDFEVDHIDGNPENNKIENLRLCTDKENARNRKKTQQQH